MLNEAETRAKLIDPKLYESGWKEEMIKREHVISPGRIIDEEGKRQKGTRIDYILYYNLVPIAVVEAEPEFKSELSGMGQAKDYAERLYVLFAYSTNGHKIEEFDFTTNIQKTLDRFPTPEELWERYLRYKFRDSDGLRIDPLSYPYHYLPNGKYPRYFQEVAVRKVIEAILNNKKRILLTMATGSGKTYVAFQIAWKLIKSGYLQRILYIADRKFLRDQAYNEFAPFEDARALIEEGKDPRNRAIYFSIYQAMYSGEENNRLYQKYPSDYFDLIIIDECHRSGYGTWKEILDYFSSAIHLGMTATPKRNDNIDTYAYFGEPVYSYSMGQAIEDGFLAPFQIFRYLTNVDREGLSIKEAIEQGAQIFVPEEEQELKEVYTLELFEREITLPDRTKKLCEHLANLLEMFGPLQKTIVFCVNMEHAATVAKYLQNRFSYLNYSDYAVRIVSEEPIAKEYYERFRDSERKTPVVVTTVDLLTTGVDVPSVRNIVFMRPISSKVFFKQHIGRGSRIDLVTNKYFFRIIDYVNATRLIDDWDYPTNVKVERIIEGLFNLSLEGIVVHYATQVPISDARIEVQIAPNTKRVTKSDQNGRFVLSQLPHSPVTFYISKTGFKNKQLTIVPSEGSQQIIIELKPERTGTRKISIEGIDVYIAEETRIIPLKDGRTLKDAEYIEYSKEGIVKRAATLEELKVLWLSEKRAAFLEELKNESISPKILADIIKIPDADTFDIIAHVAFGVPVLTRDERASMFINKKQSFLSAFNKNAQEVILSLLDKYKIGGIDQLSKPEVFRLSPFDKMGYLQGVAKMFGGYEKLREALDALQRGLYEYIGGL